MLPPLPALRAPPALRALLADRDALPRPSGPGAHSAAMLHAYALKRLSELFSAAGVDALLVKGAALGLTVYPEPAARPMTDIDLVVRAGEKDRIVGVLLAGGCSELPVPGRRHSAHFSGETGIYVPAGAMKELVEVHTTLSKIVEHPIDWAGVFARASAAPSLPGLLVPEAEDHALLIALHAAGHDFAHTAGFVDLELLFRRGLDEDVLFARAREWGLSGVMFAMLATMRAMGAASVSAALVARFEPGTLRRGLLLRAAARGPTKPGLAWMLAQAPLRDDPLKWAAGVGRFAVARARDRFDGEGDKRAPYRAPLWVRAIVAADRVAARIENARAGFRDEALLAWVPEENRAAVTAAIYSGVETYLPGGNRFDSGLFAWELRVLGHEAFPRSGRILVGAAGAGREVVALVDRGFEVVAFDPCEPYARAAQGVAAAGNAAFVQATYGDLVDAAEGRGGPLAEAVTGVHFDAVILGWGSLSHVLPSSARAELFRAVRKLAPRAPVLASFGLQAGGGVPPPGKGRVRQTLRRAFAKLGARGVAEDGDHFFSHIGFFAYLTQEEVGGLARAGGYGVALLEEAPYAHALFTPEKAVG